MITKSTDTHALTNTEFSKIHADVLKSTFLTPRSDGESCVSEGTNIIQNALTSSMHYVGKTVPSFTYNERIHTCMRCQFYKNNMCTHRDMRIDINTAALLPTVCCPIGKWERYHPGNFLSLEQGSPVHHVKLVFNRFRKMNWPDGFQYWDNVLQAQRESFFEEAKKPPMYRENLIRDDIACVISAGGKMYWTMGFCAAVVLRESGFNHKIFLSYLGEEEMDKRMEQLSIDNGFELINMRHPNVKALYPGRISGGWECKSLGMILSNRAHCFFLDADVIVAQNIESIFSSKQYTRYGAIFWPDVFWHNPETGVPYLDDFIWNLFGLEYRFEPDFETGQFCVNNKKFLKQQELVLWVGQRSDFYYKHIFGDKSVFHLVWRATGKDFAYGAYSSTWIECGLQHYSLDKSPLLYHLIHGKERLLNGDPPTSILNWASYVHGYNILRSAGYNHAFYSHITNEERDLMRKYAGLYVYKRAVDSNHRVIELLPDGSIGEGRERCEERWLIDIRDGIPVLRIIGHSGFKGQEVVTCSFTCTDLDKPFWEGQWHWHEECYCFLEKA